MLSFLLVAEALMGLMYHRPSGENSNLQSERGDGCVNHKSTDQEV